MLVNNDLLLKKMRETGKNSSDILDESKNKRMIISSIGTFYMDRFSMKEVPDISKEVESIRRKMGWLDV